MQYRFKDFTEKANIALNLAIHGAQNLGHTYVGTEHIMLGLLQEGTGVASTVLGARGITSVAYEKKIIETESSGSRTYVTPRDFTPRAKSTLEQAIETAAQMQYGYAGTEHLLLALLKDKNSIGVRLLYALEPSADKIEKELNDTCHTTFRSTDKRLQKEGNRTALSQFGRDLTALASVGKIDPVIGRDREIERVIRILMRRTKNNPCLIGEPGVGKTAIAEGLADKIVREQVPEPLLNKKVIYLDLNSMIAGTKYRGDFEERIKKAIEEVKSNSRIILFIDELHTLIGAGTAEGAVDAANILKPYLARGELQVIGATTLQEYRKHIEKDAALERRFQPVKVEEPTPEQTVQILYGLRDKYEAHHKVKISDEAIRTAVELSVRYIADRFLPDKAIDVIDETAAGVRLKSADADPEVHRLEDRIKELESEKKAAVFSQDFETAIRLRDEEQQVLYHLMEAKEKYQAEKQAQIKVVTPEDVTVTISQWAGIPVSELTVEEEEVLKHLESLLSQRVIGQEKAIKAVAQAIRRNRAGLQDPKRPIGSFIFLGPSGVGKTELCKAVATIVFGSEENLIRLDMSEYMEKHAVSRIIGSPPGYVGYDDGGQLTEKVRRRPYSVILFDEVEKAHSDIYNLLLQVLEDGILTDSQGRQISFRNTILIMTSNLGARRLTESRTLGFSEADEQQTKRDMEKEVLGELKKYFRPEFLNRVDACIVFDMLNHTTIRKIAQKMLQELQERLDKIRIKTVFSEEVTELLIHQCKDKKCGVRPLRRAIRTMIENPLADIVIEQRAQQPMKVIITVQNGKPVFSTEKEQA